MNWLLPSILALFLYGLWAFLPKLTSKYLDPTSGILYEALGGMVVGIVMLVAVRFQPEFHFRGALFGIATGICMLAGGLCFLYAAKHGSLPIIVTLTALYPAVTLLISYVVLGETVSPRQMVGVGLACIAIGLIAS